MDAVQQLVDGAGEDLACLDEFEGEAGGVRGHVCDSGERERGEGHVFAIGGEDDFGVVGEVELYARGSGWYVLEWKRRKGEKTNLETPVAEAPYADVAHALIIPNDRNRPLLLLHGPDGRLHVEVLAHVPPEFGPHDAILLAVGLGHGDFFQTAVVRLGEEYEWDSFECEIVIGSVEVLVAVVGDSMPERLVVGAVDDDADAAVSEDVPDAEFRAVIHPFGDEGEVIGWGVPIAEGGRGVVAGSEGGDDVVPKLFRSGKDGGWIGVDIHERAIGDSEFL